MGTLTIVLLLLAFIFGLWLYVIGVNSDDSVFVVQGAFIIIMTMAYAGYFWGEAETPEPTIEPSWHEFETPSGTVFSCYGRSDDFSRYIFDRDCVREN